MCSVRGILNLETKRKYSILLFAEIDSVSFTIRGGGGGDKFPVFWVFLERKFWNFFWKKLFLSTLLIGWENGSSKSEISRLLIGLENGSTLLIGWENGSSKSKISRLFIGLENGSRLLIGWENGSILLIGWEKVSSKFVISTSWLLLLRTIDSYWTLFLGVPDWKKNKLKY